MNKDNNSVAVYAGTFDPITNGHIDIIKRASGVFDLLYLAIVDGSPKTFGKSTLFDIEERIRLAESAISEYDSSLSDIVKVRSFSGMLVDFVRSVEARIIIRGLRAVSDYEYETQLAHTNRTLDPEIETIFFVTSERTSYISSSIVKNVALNGGDISNMVPSVVSDAFKNKRPS